MTYNGLIIFFNSDGILHQHKWCQDIAVGMFSRQRLENHEIVLHFRAGTEAKSFLFSKSSETGSGSPTSLVAKGQWRVFCRGLSGRRMSHFSLRLKIRGAVSPLPTDAFLARRGIALFTCTNMYLLIRFLVCPATVPQPLPERTLHKMRSSTASLNFQIPLVSWNTSSSYLSRLPRLPVTFIPSSIFPLITSFRRQFLRKMCPTEIAFLLITVPRTFLTSLTPFNISFLTR